MSKYLLSAFLCVSFSVATLFAQPTIVSFAPSSGLPGTLVTITGTGLSGPLTVTLGGTNAVVVSGAVTSVVAMVMPGSTNGPVTVTNAGGTDIANGSFTMLQNAAQAFHQQGAKIVGANASNDANQGQGVDISADGNTAIIGGNMDNGAIGAAWVYTRSSSGVWTQQGAKLVGTGASGNAQQGYSVALSADGNTAMIGGPNDNPNLGAAWVFTRSNGIWTQQGAKLVGTGYANSPLQAQSVSLSADGNTALISGRNDNSGIGAMWVFTRSNGIWSQQGPKLIGTGATGTASQGVSVHISADGNTVITGGTVDNVNIGAAWIFTRNNGVWTQQGNKLVGTGNAGISNQGIGVSISADGNTAVVGGGTDNASMGAIWVYTRNNGVWTQQGNKLLCTGNTGTAFFGSSVAVSADGNKIFAGGYYDNTFIGASWIFTRTGTTWSQQGAPVIGTGGNGVQFQGGSIALSADGTIGIVGGYVDNNGAGAVWVHGSLSNNADLDALQISAGSITPAVAGSTTAYTVSVSSTTTSVTITPTVHHINAAVSVNGFTVTSGTVSGPIALGIGNNNINITVLAEDGFTTKTYSVNVVRGQSSNADLSALTISQGVLSPAFATAVISYTATVSNNITNLTITPTVSDITANVTVNGISVISGTASAAITLNVGSNIITTRVMAQDGTTKLYSVTITRLPSSDANLIALTVAPANLSPAFAATVTSYTSIVPNATASVTVAATLSDLTALLRINNSVVSSGQTVALSLAVGSNTISAKVQAADGTIKDYTVVIVRTAPVTVLSPAATLTALAISAGTLSPAFTSTITNYSATLSYQVTDITVTPTVYNGQASIAINGSLVQNATASLPIPLNIGSNTIDVMVTAQDGTTKNYEVVVLVNVSIASSLTTICAGSSVPLTYATAGGTWISNDNAVATVNAAGIVTGTGAGQTVISYAVLRNNSRLVLANYIFIVNAQPQIGISSSSGNTFCAGSTLLTAAGGIVYKWFKDGVLLFNSTPQIFPLTEGSFRITGLNAFGCEGRSGDIILLAPQPVRAAFTYNTPACTNTPVLFSNTASSTDPTLVGFVWSDGNGNTSNNVSPSFTYSQPGNFSVKLKTFLVGCPAIMDSITKIIGIEKPIDPVRLPTITVDKNLAVLLHARPFSNTTYIWAPATYLSSAGIREPIITTAAEQQYTISMRTLAGCETVDTLLVGIKSVPAIYVPNAFSPNGNGVNDVFKPNFIGISSLKLFRIFNKWGQLIFSTNNLSDGWDGKYRGIMQPTDTYVWIIDGMDNNGNYINKQGLVTLLR